MSNPCQPNLVRIFFILCCSLVSVTAASQSSLSPELVPGPDYLPDQVVAIQMNALGKNDLPFENAGIEITYRFAAPSNKLKTGPLDRFTRLFDSPAYQPMLNHRLIEVGEAQVFGSKARVPVFVEAADGTRIAYLFVLGLQSGDPCNQCWMTEAVMPVTAVRPEST